VACDTLATWKGASAAEEVAMQSSVLLPQNGSSVPRDPLLTCPQFTTTDPDEAVAECTKVLAPHQMDVRGDLDSFQAHVSAAELHGTSVCYMDYRNPLTFHCAPWNSFVAVILPLSGDMGVSYDKGELLQVSRGSCAVLPPSQRFEMQFSTGFSLLALTAQMSALSAGLGRIAPEVNRHQLTFEGSVANEGRLPGTFYGLAGLFVDIIGQFNSPTSIPSRVAAMMSEQTVSTFLLGLRHSGTEHVMGTAVPISSRIVRQAVDILVSDVYAEKTVTDLAADIGVSMRSLELGFRREFDCTPHAYIQRFRLQRARDLLYAARSGDGTTVTEVAVRSGFNHTGRFASLYRRTYGVNPSETLRDCGR
jgi:AraC-like DNA-binding protein